MTDGKRVTLDYTEREADAMLAATAYREAYLEDLVNPTPEDKGELRTLRRTQSKIKAVLGYE